MNAAVNVKMQVYALMESADAEMASLVLIANLKVIFF